MTGPLRDKHVTCLEAVDAQQATVGSNGYAINGKGMLTGDLHLAMADLHLRGLVWGPADPVEHELLWLTTAGEQALAGSKQTEEIR